MMNARWMTRFFRSIGLQRHGLGFGLVLLAAVCLLGCEGEAQDATTVSSPVGVESVTAVVVPTSTPVASVESMVEAVGAESVTAVVVPTPTSVASVAAGGGSTATVVSAIRDESVVGMTDDWVEVVDEVDSGVDAFSFGYSLGAVTDRAWELAVMLAEELSPRESATDDELRAAEYLSDVFAGLGLDSELQDFEAPLGFPMGSLSVGASADGGYPLLFDQDATRVYAYPMFPILDGSARGELVYVGLGKAEDFAGVDLSGKVALVRRGEITFQEKHDRAVGAGAVGVAVFNSSEDGGYILGRLMSSPLAPVVGLTWGQGMRLVSALDSGAVVDVEISTADSTASASRNVVADLENGFSGDDVVIIGAHYDTTPGSSGANDNGSGVAALLTIAETLSSMDERLPFDVRFILFGSEETGLHGSSYYVSSLTSDEMARVAGMINLDSMGSGDLQVFGMGEMASVAYESAERAGLDLGVPDVSLGRYSSDHSPFIDGGYEDVLWLSADELSRINSPRDTLDHMDAEPIGYSVAVVLEVLMSLADDGR